MYLKEATPKTMNFMIFGVATLKYIGWEPFTGIGENEVRSGTEWAKCSVACSADSVTVFEVRWLFYLPSK